jgi:hypothetical protein
MISVVVLIALATGVALGVACSALYVARGQAVGWLVIQQRQDARYGSLPPSRPIGAETWGREVASRWSARSEARTYDLDAAERPRTIQARPGAGYGPHAIAQGQPGTKEGQW